MKQINAYASFNGNCREAMSFYQQCFGGELSLMTVGESPMAAQMPEESHHTIMHSSLTNGNVALLGSDMGCQQGFEPGSRVSLMVSCESEEEINRLYTQLSDGGEVSCPLGEQFWGSTFASLTDKFGLNWLLDYNKGTQA